MRPTEELKEEHNAIKKMLEVMGKVAERLDSGGRVNAEHLDRIVEFLKVFADKCHHGKEEDLLFPAMIEAGAPKEGGPIGVMLKEHEIGRGYIRSMGKSISNYGKGDKQASSDIARDTRAYTHLLSQHIEKENTVLFAMADKILSEGKRKELIEGFEEIEKNVIGPGRHEEFHELLHELSEFYIRGP
ncbi:MAG: hemerythrin domain-containing protein [Thermoplasmata archaeon]